MATQTAKRRSRRSTKAQRHVLMVFERQNYVLMAVGVLLIVVGFILMRKDNQVDGFISLYIAPLILFAGYLEVIYAILWRPKPASEKVTG